MITRVSNYNFGYAINNRQKKASQPQETKPSNGLRFKQIDTKLGEEAQKIYGAIQGDVHKGLQLYWQYINFQNLTKVTKEVLEEKSYLTHELATALAKKNTEEAQNELQILFKVLFYRQDINLLEQVYAPMKEAGIKPQKEQLDNFNHDIFWHPQQMAEKLTIFEKYDDYDLINKCLSTLKDNGCQKFFGQGMFISQEFNQIRNNLIKKGHYNGLIVVVENNMDVLANRGCFDTLKSMKAMLSKIKEKVTENDEIMRVENLITKIKEKPLTN